ncbi:MAG: zinc ribbon domain-containing protein [Thermodesulfobacteriota bacterium]|nr:zinc ribbon domain-containing protein [Thermodesulfobacteriota bacterium]
MPIYEYKCNKCGNTFEQLVFASDGNDALPCPSCGDKETSRLMSSFSCSSSSSGVDLGSALPSSGCSPSGGFS